MEDVKSDRIKGRQMDVNLPLRPRSCPRCRTTATGFRKGRKGSRGTRANSIRHEHRQGRRQAVERKVNGDIELGLAEKK